MPQGEMKDVIDRILTALMTKAPFLSSLLREARIISTDKLPAPAAISPRGWIYINPKFFLNRDFVYQSFVLCHENLHAANFHAKRAKDKKNKGAWQWAVDCVVNRLLLDMIRIPTRDIITPEKVAGMIRRNADEVERMSDIEIYEFLKDKRFPEIEILFDLLSEELEGETIQRGGDFNDSTNPDEQRDGWKRAITKAYTSQKLIGRVPAGLERWVNELIKPKIDPRTLFKQQIQAGLGKLAVSTWRRVSRKVPELPGLKRYTIPALWGLVDCSGSIGDDELKLFLGTLYEFAGMTKISVIAWDAEAYETIRTENRAQVMKKVARRLKGGGGTVIAPCLERVLREMKSRDIVTVLSDGDIFDLGKESTKKLFRNVSMKSSVSVFCYTHSKPNIESEGWRVVELKPA